MVERYRNLNDSMARRLRLSTEDPLAGLGPENVEAMTNELRRQRVCHDEYKPDLMSKENRFYMKRVL